MAPLANGNVTCPRVAAGWSYDTGYAGKVTRIERLNYDEVVVTGERTDRPRSVSRTEFKKVFEIWDRDKQGLLSRKGAGDISRNAIYIFSILHWFERSADET